MGWLSCSALPQLQAHAHSGCSSLSRPAQNRIVSPPPCPAPASTHCLYCATVTSVLSISKAFTYTRRPGFSSLLHSVSTCSLQPMKNSPAGTGTTSSLGLFPFQASRFAASCLRCSSILPLASADFFSSADDFRFGCAHTAEPSNTSIP